MSSELTGLVETLRDTEAVGLMARVKGDLESGAVDHTLATLSPEEARRFLDAVAAADVSSGRITDAAAAGEAARRFLAELSLIPPLEPVIVARLAEGGVRLNFSDVVAWAKGTFNLATLIGLQFSYEGETIEITETEGRKVEKRRKISLAVGKNV